VTAAAKTFEAKWVSDGCRKRDRRRKITWMIMLRMRAMRLRSIGKRRWYFCWRARFLELHEVSRSHAKVAADEFRQLQPR
jgi:hypothetical protein